MLNRYLVIAIIFAAQLQLAGNISAQDTGIEEILVTADPLSNVDTHLIQPAQVLSKQELKTRSIQNIGETVSSELGVTSSDFGAGSGRPVIRGQGGGRVKVLESGISSMDASTVSNDHAATTEPVFAEQIEILRGPATLLYGSGASGGLVNVVTNRIPTQLPEGILDADAVLQYESVNDGVTGAASINAGADNFAIHLSGMKRDTNNYDIPGFAESVPDEGEEPGTVENSATETETVAAGASYIGDAGMIGFSVTGLDNAYGIPGHHHHEEGAVVEEVGGVTIDMQQNRYDFAAALDSPFQGLREIKTRWGYNDYEHAEIEPNGDTGTLFSNEEMEGRVEAIHEPMGNWDGVFGVQLNKRDFAAIGEEAFLPPSKQDAIALFLVEKADFNLWHLDLGMRYEDQSSDARTGASADHDLISIGGGANYEYSDGYLLGVSVGRNQRGPTIEELFANGPHLATNSFEVGHSGLGDETSTNIDLSWHKTGGRQTFKLNLFYNMINDFTYLQEQDLNGDGVPDRVREDFSGNIAEILPRQEDEEPLLLFHSQADASFVGFEAETILNLVESAGSTLDVRLWTDFVNGKLKDNGHLPRINPLRVGAGLDYETGPWYFNLDYTHTEDQNNTAALEDPTPGYNMLNLYAGYTFDVQGTSFTLFARGTNLLDEEVRRHTSIVKNIAPLAGRSGIIGIRAAF